MLWSSFVTLANLKTPGSLLILHFEQFEQFTVTFRLDCRTLITAVARLFTINLVNPSHLRVFSPLFSGHKWNAHRSWPVTRCFCIFSSEIPCFCCCANWMESRARERTPERELAQSSRNDAAIRAKRRDYY